MSFKCLRRSLTVMVCLASAILISSCATDKGIIRDAEQAKAQADSVSKAARIAGQSEPLPDIPRDCRLYERAGLKDSDRVDVAIKKYDNALIGTGTISVKDVKLTGERFERVTDDLAEIAKAVASDPASISTAGMKQLEEIHKNMGGVIDAARIDAGEDERLARQAVAGQAFRDVQKHLKQ